MVSLISLWMPIAGSAVLVFALSAVLHMVLKYHQADYKKLPSEESQIESLRGLEPGYYHFPYCADMKAMGSPEMMEKMRRGPVGFVTILPSGPPAMGKFLGLWFVYCLLVSLFGGYIAAHTVGAGVAYLAVFRVIGATTFMAYALPNMVDSIWRGAPWSNTIRATIDGILYALVSAGVFGWLWPH